MVIDKLAVMRHKVTTKYILTHIPEGSLVLDIGIGSESYWDPIRRPPASKMRIKGSKNGEQGFTLKTFKEDLHIHRSLKVFEDGASTLLECKKQSMVRILRFY